MKLHCTMLYNVIMEYDAIKDIEFIKEVLQINDSVFSEKTCIPRSSLNNWHEFRNRISAQSLEKLYSFAYKSGIRLNELKQQLFIDVKAKDEVILFHGAKTDIKGELSLDYAREKNDFGKGIYMGESLQQSASYVSGYRNSSVYIFKYHLNDALRTIEYEVDQEWMLAIAYYRGRLDKYCDNIKINTIAHRISEADIVIAPIADNNMYQLIDDFVLGNITDKQCLASLSATDLGKQYVFLNDRALQNVEMIHHCYLCKEEKEYYQKEKAERNGVGLQKVKYASRAYAGKGKYIEELFK